MKLRYCQGPVAVRVGPGLFLEAVVGHWKDAARIYDERHRLGCSCLLRPPSLIVTSLVVCNGPTVGSFPAELCWANERQCPVVK